MLSPLIYTGIIILLLILFGPYRIILSSKNNEDRDCWVVTVSAWRKFYSFRWILTHEDRLFSMLLFDRRIFSMKKAIHATASDERKRKKSRRKKISITCLLHNGSSRLFVWLGIIRKIFRLHKLEGVCEYGFADPAVTGIVYGWFFVLKSCYPIIDLDIHPRFYQSRLRGEFKILIKTILIQLLFHSVRLGIEGFRVYRICSA